MHDVSRVALGGWAYVEHGRGKTGPAKFTFRDAVSAPLSSFRAARNTSESHRVEQMCEMPTIRRSELFPFMFSCSTRRGGEYDSVRSYMRTLSPSVLLFALKLCSILSLDFIADRASAQSTDRCRGCYNVNLATENMYWFASSDGTGSVRSRKTGIRHLPLRRGSLCGDRSDLR